MSEDELAQRLSVICPTFPIYMPQDNEVFPAIVYSVVGVNSNATICGPSDEDKRVQVDCYAKTYGELLALRENVLDVLLDAEKLNDFDAFVENSTLYRRTLEFYI